MPHRRCSPLVVQVSGSMQAVAVMRSMLLPHGFPDSVAPQFAPYMSWRAAQVAVLALPVLTLRALESNHPLQLRLPAMLSAEAEMESLAEALWTLIKTYCQKPERLHLQGRAGKKALCSLTKSADQIPHAPRRSISSAAQWACCRRGRCSALSASRHGSPARPAPPSTGSSRTASASSAASCSHDGAPAAANVLATLRYEYKVATRRRP